MINHSYQLVFCLSKLDHFLVFVFSCSWHGLRLHWWEMSALNDVRSSWLTSKGDIWSPDILFNYCLHIFFSDVKAKKMLISLSSIISVFHRSMMNNQKKVTFFFSPSHHRGHSLAVTRHSLFDWGLLSSSTFPPCSTNESNKQLPFLVNLLRTTTSQQEMHSVQSNAYVKLLLR